jgi:hypothetical protein
MSFAMAIASRGFSNSKTDLNTKKLRYVSCFGIDEIPACELLKKSEKSDFYYCGGCNCGDHSHTWLVKNDGEYSKLDYPFLNCPLKMPGFNNYDMNGPGESLKRKQQIEQMDSNKLKLIQLTVSVDPEKQKLFEKVSNVLGNS